MRRIKAYESEESFSCSYLGDGEINALTLTESVTSIVGMLQDSSTHYNSKAYVNLKVTAIKHGSFQIDLRALVGGASFLMAFGVSEYAEILVDALAVFLDLKKFLIGDKPENVTYNDDSVTVQNCNGEIHVYKNVGAVNLFTTNPNIDKHVSNMFTAAAMDQTEGFLLQHKGQKVTVTPDEFHLMAKHVITESIIEPHIQTIDMDIGIKKPDLGGNSQWAVYGFGRTFFVAFEDRSWIARVHSGEIMLANGMQLRVRLRIHTDLDQDGNLIENTEKFFVEEVYEIIPQSHPKIDNQTALK